MKFKSVVLLGLGSVFAVACAHKKVEHKEVAVQSEVKKEVVGPQKIESPKVADKKSSEGVSINCTLGKDARVITLQKGDKRCEVHYTKNGELNEIAWGEKTPSICDNVFDNVKTNIEKGGFKCASDSQNTASM